MKRYIVLGLVLILGFSSCTNANKEKVLLFIKHGGSYDIEFHLQQEVDVMISMLEKAGFIVAEIYGDMTFGAYHPKSSHDLVIVARKV